MAEAARASAPTIPDRDLAADTATGVFGAANPLMTVPHVPFDQVRPN